VWQACEGEPAVGEPHALGIVRQDLIGCLNHHAFVFGNGLTPRLLDALLENEFMNLCHVGTVTVGEGRRKFGNYVRKLLEGI
jgi:hypothetical protein